MGDGGLVMGLGMMMVIFAGAGVGAGHHDQGDDADDIGITEINTLKMLIIFLVNIVINLTVVAASPARTSSTSF